MAVHDDPRGVWATIQFIRRHYPAEMLKHIEFLILDNNPRSKKGEAVRDFALNKFTAACPCRYLSVEPRNGTALRSLLAWACDTEYLMMIDSHVMVLGLDKTVMWLKECANNSNDLFHGILVNESNAVIGTHQNPGLRGGMFGTWGVHPQTPDMRYTDMEPFEIPMHGCGLLLFRRDSWLGFPHSFEDFGGEEGYIQEKYRLYGRKCWTLPFLKWEHHFGHPGGTTYTLTHEGKYRNHLIGWTELGLPLDIVDRYFGSRLPPEVMARIKASVESLDIRPIPWPAGHVPFMGYPIRINDHCANESQDYRAYEKLVFSHSVPTPD